MPPVVALTMIVLMALVPVPRAIRSGVGTVPVGASVTSSSGAGSARAAATYFLSHYEISSGRVVRWDQGGDTVSEGQAYAMLLAVALDDRTRFDAVWSWTKQHLMQPSGLLAWHWQGGKVVDPQPAADADLDAAFALELASQRFDQKADRVAAAMLAGDIVANETVVVPGGRVLAAGPWATSPTVYSSPSYASPEELIYVGLLGTDAADYAAMASTARAQDSVLLGPNTLPPDWITVNTSGQAEPTVPPQVSGGVVYGFDAVRMPIRWASSCDRSDRAAVARLWPVLSKLARRGQPTVDLSLSGSPGSNASRAAVGLVAAAASGVASGHRRVGAALLASASQMNRSQPTYYSSAWVALGEEMLETNNLDTCGASVS